MGYLLGIDVGTSGTKTLLIEACGRVVASATAEYPCYTPQPAWSEQEPEDWVRAVGQTVRQVLAEAPRGEVLAIGLSGQMHGSVFLDSADEVIRPAILSRTGLGRRSPPSRASARSA